MYMSPEGAESMRSVPYWAQEPMRITWNGAADTRGKRVANEALQCTLPEVTLSLGTKSGFRLRNLIQFRSRIQLWNAKHY